MVTIMVVDDDAHIRRTLSIMLRGDGHQVVTAADGEAARALVEEHEPDMVLLDIQLPGMSGMELLEILHEAHPTVEVVMVTAYGTIELAVEAIKAGAFDFVTKPFSPDQLRHRIRRIEELTALRARVTALEDHLEGLTGGGDFVTRNPRLLSILERAKTVAETDVPLLVTGESGTGKNHLVRLIHRWSPRRAGPLTLVDMASLHDTLLESELFGHARGAFTGAVAQKPGKVEAASGGTLLLDEIGELPLPLQGKLLRLVEEHTYERLGDPTPRTIDARIVAATNRPLDEMAEAGEFRTDLLYRLSVVELALPPLRERPEDIVPLAERFAASAAARHGRPVERLSDALVRHLTSRPWPGNVRELANVIEGAVLMAKGSDLEIDDIPPRQRSTPTTSSEPREILPLAEVELRHLKAALAAGLPLEETAHKLGIDPSTLWRKRKRYGI